MNASLVAGRVITAAFLAVAVYWMFTTPRTPAPPPTPRPTVAPSPKPVSGEKLVAPLYDKYLAHKARLDPNWATEQGIHVFDDKLTRFDDATRTEGKLLVEEMLAGLAKIDLDAAGVDERLDARLWKAQLETELFDWRRVDSRTIQPGAPLGAVSVIYTTLVKDFAPAGERARNALKRLRELPRVIAEAQTYLKSPPKIWTEMAIDDGTGSVGAVQEFIALAKPHLDEKEQAEFTDVAVKAQEALAGYVGFLKSDVLPRSNGEFAVGRTTYDYYLKNYHLLGLDADTLIAIGRREWDKSIAMLTDTAKKIDPARTWQEILKEMKKDHPTPANLVETYHKVVAKARQYMIDHEIVTLPEGEKLEIVETPQFERSSIPYAAYHAPGPLDEARVGHFYVTPVDPKSSPEEQDAQLTGHNIYDIPGTVWHEAYPGHHTQFLYAKTLTSKIRALNNSPLLSEGWGFYCEELANETGFYTDPRERLMQLNWRLQRAARIILDVSVHTGLMTFDQAVDFLMKEVQMEKPQAEGSVKGYSQSPSYFMAYMVGMLEIVRIRDEAKARLGSKFTLRGFHDRWLRYGNVPPALIEAELGRDWK